MSGAISGTLDSTSEAVPDFHGAILEDPVVADLEAATRPATKPAAEPGKRRVVTQWSQRDVAALGAWFGHYSAGHDVAELARRPHATAEEAPGHLRERYGLDGVIRALYRAHLLPSQERSGRLGGYSIDAKDQAAVERLLGQVTALHDSYPGRVKLLCYALSRAALKEARSRRSGGAEK